MLVKCLEKFKLQRADHSKNSILRNLFTFCPCKEFEDIRLVAPAPHISCLHFCLVF